MEGIVQTCEGVTVCGFSIEQFCAKLEYITEESCIETRILQLNIPTDTQCTSGGPKHETKKVAMGLFFK
jgi:hypothetical protein